MKMKTKKKGFTLIELLVCLFIIDDATDYSEYC